MQQDGSPSEGRQSQVAAQLVEQQQQQQQTAQQQRTSAEQAPPQQLQPVPEPAAAAASADDAQRRQAHVPGQVHVTLKVHPRRQMQTIFHGSAADHDTVDLNTFVRTPQYILDPGA